MLATNAGASFGSALLLPLLALVALWIWALVPSKLGG